MDSFLLFFSQNDYRGLQVFQFLLNFLFKVSFRFNPRVPNPSASQPVLPIRGFPLKSNAKAGRFRWNQGDPDQNPTGSDRG